MARKVDIDLLNSTEKIIQKSLYKDKILAISKIKKHLGNVKLSTVQKYIKKQESLTMLMKGIYLKGCKVESPLSYIHDLMALLKKRYYYFYSINENSINIIVIGRNQTLRPITHSGKTIVRFHQRRKLPKEFLQLTKINEAPLIIPKIPFNLINFVSFYHIFEPEKRLDFFRYILKNTLEDLGIKLKGIFQNMDDETIIANNLSGILRLWDNLFLAYKNNIFSFADIKRTVIWMDIVCGDLTNLLKNELFQEFKTRLISGKKIKVFLPNVPREILRKWNASL